MKNLRKFKKLSTALSLVLCLSIIFSGNVFAIEKNNLNSDINNLKAELVQTYSNSEQKNTINKYINIYLNDPMFKEHYKKDTIESMAMIKRVIESKIVQLQFMDNKISPQSNSGNYFYATGVGCFKQGYNNSCGAASAIQVMYSYGVQGSVPGSTTKAKEKTIFDKYKLTPTEIGQSAGNGLSVYMVSGTINKYVGSLAYNPYSYIECTNMSYDDFVINVKYSLLFNGPVILHAIPKYITSVYPSTATGGHYIAVRGINIDNGTIEISDCNYNSKYYGEKTISIREAYNSVHSTSGRYLIGIL